LTARHGARGRAAARAAGTVLLNDRLLPAARATIAALDRGFLYGDGLFETLRTYGGEPFALAQHLRRLARSARAFRIPFVSTPAYWRPRVRRLLAANRLDGRDAAVRLTVSRGAGPLGLLPPPGLRPTVLLLASPLDERLAEAQARGVAVCFFPYRLATATLPSHKTLHYLPAVLGKMVAQRRSAWETLYLSADDGVLEGTTSNVFAVHGRRLTTPPLAGILPGVTRRVLATVARRAGLTVTEKPLERAALLAADEVFLTASTIEVLPVVRIERARIGDGKPGAVTRLLQERYRRHVARAVGCARR
jgi:branched-subunit amino acid aminotransferase/4-amino-4-deoxychorismate lyase